MKSNTSEREWKKEVWAIKNNLTYKCFFKPPLKCGACMRGRVYDIDAECAVCGAQFFEGTAEYIEKKTLT